MAKNNITFGRWETTAAVVNALSVQVILNFPRSMAEIGGTAAWIVALYICILALLGFSIVSKLYKKFEGKDLLDLGEHIGGNTGRIIVGVILIIYFTFIISVVLREFGEDMKVISLNVSPISFVILFFIAGMITAAYFGIEAIMRFHAIIVPIVILAFLAISIGVAPYYDFTNLLPILGNGPKEIFGKGFFRVSSFSALVALFMYYPFIKTHRNFKIVGYTSLGIASVFFITSCVTYLSVYRYGSAIENFLPIFQLSRLISYGRFFQRIESVFVLAWAAAAMLYLSQGFFLTVYIFKKTFKLEYYKPLIIPFAVIVFAISLIPQNLMSAIRLETDFLRNTAALVTFVMTILLLLIARAVKRGRRKGEAEE